ncbi:espin, partial [Biomphalaria pfeifferi]
TNKSRSPHPSFPPPPSYPPDHVETGTSTYSPGSVSPPLPPPPIPASPASSTPQTSGSTISPPTPLSEAEDEIKVLQSSSVRQYSRPSGGEVAAAKGKVTRTVSVKVDVHHTPKHISTNSQPSTSTGNYSPAEESRVSSRVSNQEASTYSRPGVVNIYSKPARVSSVKSKQQTQPVVSSPVTRGSSLSLSSSSLQSNSSVTSTTSTSSLSSPDSITASPDDSSAGKKLKKPYYATQYRQDFDTVTKTKFAQVKALFQQGATESEYVCPDSGEVCKREENHLFADKQAPGHIRKMSEQAPPPLPSSQTESDQTLTNGAASVQNGGSKSVVNIHGGHVTIISTGGSSDEIISTASNAANKNSLRPLSGSIVLTSGHSGSDNVSALMKELSLRKPPIQVNGDAKPLVHGESSSNNSGHNAMTRPASVHSSVNSARDNVDKSKVNYSRSSSSSSANSQPHSPVDVSNKHNLIADIQSAVSGSSNLSLRRAKNRGEGVNMVYQSRKSTGGITDVKTDHRPLTGQFDPKNFLDQIEKVDASGLVIPEWRRQVLAKHAAEKAQKEYEEKKLFEDNEERFKNVPAWKRAIIEKKEAEAREAAAAALKK